MSPPALLRVPQALCTLVPRLWQGGKLWLRGQKGGHQRSHLKPFDPKILMQVLIFLKAEDSPVCCLGAHGVTGCVSELSAGLGIGRAGSGSSQSSVQVQALSSIPVAPHLFLSSHLHHEHHPENHFFPTPTAAFIKQAVLHLVLF